MQELNPLLHSQLRLAIMSVLLSAEEADFVYLKEKTEATGWPTGHAGICSGAEDLFLGSLMLRMKKMLPSDGFSDLTDDSILLLGGCYCLSGESELSLSISRKRPKNLLPAQMMPAIRAMETKPLKNPLSKPGRLSQNGR